VAVQKALQRLQRPAYLKLSTDKNSGVKIKQILREQNRVATSVLTIIPVTLQTTK
jgi:hypothetical protein